MTSDYYLNEITAFRAMFGMRQDWETHEKLYQEESNELQSATNQELTADGLADTVVIMAGWCIDHKEKMKDWPLFIRNMEYMAKLRGINLRAAFDIVCTSNRSKACLPDEVVPTQQKHADMGVETYVESLDGENLFAVYSAKDHEGDLSDFIKGKLLKSINYQKPDWSRTDWLLNPTT